MTTAPTVWNKAYKSWLWNLKPGDIVQVNTSDFSGRNGGRFSPSNPTNYRRASQ